MKVGILGGTFDPPHIGHLAIAEAALEQLELDEVLFLPTNRNPLKARIPTSSAKQRLAMVERLVKDHDQFAVSDLEITRGGSSYTVDTLSELTQVQPAEYWILMGADAFKGFPSWKSPHRILQMARLGVALRPPTVEADLSLNCPEDILAALDIVRIKPTEVSSTDLRKRITLNQSVTPWVAPAVLSYIHENKLYRN